MKMLSSCCDGCAEHCSGEESWCPRHNYIKAENKGEIRTAVSEQLLLSFILHSVSIIKFINGIISFFNFYKINFYIRFNVSLLLYKTKKTAHVHISYT